MTPIIAWARSGAGQPESQEAQRRLGDDDAADVDAEDDDDRRHDIGQDMANQYSRRADRTPLPAAVAGSEVTTFSR